MVFFSPFFLLNPKDLRNKEFEEKKQLIFTGIRIRNQEWPEIILLICFVE